MNWRSAPGLPLATISAAPLEPLADDEAFVGLLPEFAARWPVPREVPWLPALGDGACSNVGAGCATRERLALNVGTSGALRALWEADPPQADAVPPGLWRYRLDRRRVVVGGAVNDRGPPEADSTGSSARCACRRSPVWLQVTADALGRPVRASTEPEASSRGAALYALERLPPQAGPAAWRPCPRRTVPSTSRSPPTLLAIAPPPSARNGSTRCWSRTTDNRRWTIDERPSSGHRGAPGHVEADGVIGETAPKMLKAPNMPKLPHSPAR